MQNTIAVTHYRLTTNDYHKMAEVGILDKNSRVELINGAMITMPPIGSTHAYTVDQLNRILTKKANMTQMVRIQNPIQLGQHDEPEPDIAIVKDNNYADTHPTAEDVILVIEVSDTTLSYDRSVKGELYAKHDICEYWIINLKDKQIEIYTQPKDGQYQETQITRGNRSLSPLSLSNITLTAQALSQILA